MLEVIHTDGAPQAIGPYSQAVCAHPFVFVSGQIALDPKTGDVVDGPVSVQTERVLQNIKAILAVKGSSLEQVLKTTIYLTRMEDFAEVNEVYARHFETHRPARATVAVAALPKGVSVEIDAVALIPSD